MAQDARKQAVYEKRLAELNEEWEAVYSQIGRELDEVNQLRLKRQAQQLEQEIADVENQLNQLSDPADASVKLETFTDNQSQSSKYNIHIENATGLIIGDHAAVAQVFSSSDETSRSPDSSVATARLVKLSDLMAHYFNLEEVRDLCFRLGIDYDDLGGEGKSGKVRELVMRLELNGRLPNLLPLLKQLRQHVSWE
jgi:uncharacterized protein YhaN